MINRRAEISTKKLDYAPTAVGTPPADQSGQIVAQGIQDIGKALFERDDKVDSLAAMAKFGDFNAKFLQQKAELQQQYKDNPKEYPQAASALAEKLSAEYAKDLPSGPAAKFQEITTNMIAQDKDNQMQWAIKQDQDNILGSIQKWHGDIELMGEATVTPEGLKNLLGGSIHGLEAASKDASQFLTATATLALKTKTRAATIENSMNARLLNDPGRLYGDLTRGAYDGVLTTTEMRSYQTKAHQAMIEGAYQAQYNSLKTMAVTMSATADAILDGKISVGEINRMASLYELHKDKKDINGQPIVPPETLEAFKVLKSMALRQVPKTPTEKRIDTEAFMADFDRQWNKFLAEGGTKPGRDNALEEVKLYSKLLSARQDGVIDDGVFETKKKILDTRIRTKAGKKTAGMSLTQAFDMVASKPFFGLATHEDDLYSYAYNRIRDKVNAQTDISKDEKRKYIDQYFLTFIDTVGKLPPDQVNNIKNYQATANNILNGSGAENTGLFNKMMVYRHPERPAETLMYGQATTYQGHSVLFRGVNPKTGAYLFELNEGTTKGFGNR